MERAPFEKSYLLNVANVVLALFPGLINVGAVSVFAPNVAADLGVSVARAAELPLLSDGALAFGCLLAAELSRRIPRRPLYLWLQSLSLGTSLASGFAPSFPVLALAHIVHGLFGGMLFVVMLPPLVIAFGSARIRSTVSVLVPSLFGAATLGPIVGGLTASPTLWRSVFLIEAVLAVVAIVLGRLTLAPTPPPPTDDPIDYPALVLAALGTLLVFVGSTMLVVRPWSDPVTFTPIALGTGAYVAMFVVEALRAKPLVPVRRMVTSIAIVGTIATVIGSVTFGASQTSLVVTLERIGGLSPRAAGLTQWPDFLAALVAGALFGLLVRTRWVVVTGTLGLAIIALAALALDRHAPVSAAAAPWIGLALSFGAGLAVTPGLFVVTLSFERALVARAIALLNMMRLTAGFTSGPGVEHSMGSGAAVQLRGVLGTHADTAARTFLVNGTTVGASPEQFRAALTAGVSDALHVVIVLAICGVGANVLILWSVHAPLLDPDLAAFDRGESALRASNRVLIGA